MTDLELIFDLYSGTHRQGPGSDADTLLALSFVDLPADRKLQVADIGCGTGASTLVLAEALHAEITAVDFSASFLARLTEQFTERTQGSEVNPLEADMKALPFKDDQFDLIWSEGAIYNLGFEEGVKAWRPFLKSGGFLAVSEITWLRNTRPLEIDQFWNEQYPEIDTAAAKIKVLENQGYALAGYFTLPETSWHEHFYLPLASFFNRYLERHGNAKAAEEVVLMHQKEIEVYNRFKEYFSYGFYVAKKVD